MAGRVLLSMLVLCALQLSAAEIFDRLVCDPTVEGDIYGYSAAPMNGSLLAADITFDQYEGQVVLVVNVATYNELTTESYLMLNELAAEYRSQGFAILAFPTQQINREQPEATSAEFYNALYYVRPGNAYEPDFQIFKKGDINGGGEQGVFTYLKSGCSYTEDLFRTDLEYVDLDLFDVRQPFEKFLVDKSGKVQFRYHPVLSSAADLKPDIEALLNA